MSETKKQSWLDSLAVYKDIRMVRILLLGAISGFPWVLIASSLSLWLKEEGLSRSTIGWAGLIFGVYAFNYLWAPIIDRIQIPILTKKLGHRRGWIVLMQLIILLSLVVWSVINPTENLALLITVGLIIAIASATQDITVDALRIEQINEIGNFKFEDRYLNGLKWLLGGPERVSDSSQIRSKFLKIENCKKKEVKHWGGDPVKNRQRMEDVREWLTGKVEGVTTE